MNYIDKSYHSIWCMTSPSDMSYDIVIMTMTIVIVMDNVILFFFLLSLENKKRNRRVEIE